MISLFMCRIKMSKSPSRTTYLISLKGGLGNQMLQYAFGQYINKLSGSDIYFDTSFFNNSFSVGVTPRELEINSFTNINVPVYQSAFYKSKKRLKRLSRKLIGKQVFNVFEEELPHYSDAELLTKTNTYYDGYWMNYAYIQPVLSELKEYFHCDISHFSSGFKRYLEAIKKTNHSTFVHIRRGDYVSSASASAAHGLCSIEYYTKAIKHVRTIHPDSELFFFSDDIAWVKENFNESKAYFIEDTTSHFEDLELMSQCSHAIVANSSFSLWGAMLQRNDDQIVCRPKQWYQDPSALGPRNLPANWISI